MAQMEKLCLYIYIYITYMFIFIEKRISCQLYIITGINNHKILLNLKNIIREKYYL